MLRASNIRHSKLSLSAFRSLAALVALAVLAFVSSAPARGQEESADPKVDEVPVREGRLYNLTSQPLSFQLHQMDGVAWTNSYSIAPGKYFAVRAPKAGEATDIQGLTGDGRGFVIIRYPEPILGGYLTLRLPARNPSSQVLQPTWYAIQDSNGIIRMVQEPSMEQAKAVQEKLQKQPRMTPQELEHTKHMLRANWVLQN